MRCAFSPHVRILGMLMRCAFSPHVRILGMLLGCAFSVLGSLRVPAEAGGACVVVRPSPPVLRSGLRWLGGSGDDPAGCR